MIGRQEFISAMSDNAPYGAIRSKFGSKPNGVFLRPATGDKDNDGICDRRHQGD